MPSTGTGTIDVIDSITEGVIGPGPDGTAEDVDNAVKAARAAFATGRPDPEERGKFLTRIAEGLGARMDEIARSSPERPACRSG